AYFDRWWDEILAARRQQPESANALRDLLGYLLVAKGPLRRDDLIDLSEKDALDEWTVDDALALVRRQTIGDAERGFALAQPRFQSYLAEQRLRGVAQRDSREALIAYCARWRELGSEYALRHYAEHLVDGERVDELLALARDDEYAVTVYRALPAEPSL